MAIVRTTSKENGTTGSAPPNVRPKSPSAQQATPGRTPQRTLAQRASTPGTQAGNGQFLNDVKTELKRVHWPTKEEVQSGVIVTVLLLAFFALYIFGLDYVIERTLGVLFSSTPTP